MRGAEFNEFSEIQMVNGKFCVTPNAHCWKLESLQQIEAQMQQWQRKKEGMELMRHSLLSGGAWKINVTRSNQKTASTH